MPELPVQFHFLRPEWFLALLPALLLLAALWRRRLSHPALERICDASLLPHLLLTRGTASRRVPLALLALAWLLAVTALAGPVWQKQPQPVYRLASGRVLVLDLSPSMAAADITPSRLERARYKIEDILHKSREGRTALVVFGGEPHLVVPLTDDVATIAEMLPALTVDIMPVAGDSAAKALEMAATLLQREGLKGGDILLLTDGIDDLASSLGTAAKLRQQGVRLSVLGIGTEGGAPVPDPAGSGFVTGAGGAPLIARLDPSSLRELAAAGGGSYRTLTADEEDIDPLLAAADNHSLRAGDAVNRNIDRWQEEGAWLVLPLLFLALAGFRRGWLVCLLALLFLRPVPAGAMSWQDLWLRPDQQAARQLAAGNAAKAAALFRDPSWRAVAQHEAGDYQQAIETGKSLRDEAGQYNLGNSLARAGRLEDALKAYAEALKLNPDDADARANSELVSKLLEQRKQEKQQDQAGKSADQRQKGAQEKQHGGQGGQGNQSGGNAGQQQQAQKRQSGGGQQSRPDKNEGSAAGQQDQPQGAQPGRHGQQGQPGDRKDEAGQLPQEQGRQQEDKSGGQQGGAQQPGGKEQAATAEQERKGRGRPDQSGREGEGRGQALPEDNEAQRVPDAKDLVLEQWLRQVPDDPSGLLRRKFMLEHQRRLQERSAQ